MTPPSPPLVQHPSRTMLWLALAAVQTGVIAGLAALAYLMLDGMMRGNGPWDFPNLLATTFYPRSAFSSSFSMATVSGLALHIVVSGVSGVVFGVFLLRFLSRPMRALWLGGLVGVVWYYLTFRFFWTPINPAVVIYQSFPGTLLGHIVFGFCMGLYPRFVRAMGAL